MQLVPGQRLEKKDGNYYLILPFQSTVHALSVAWQIAPYGMIEEPDWLKEVIAWQVHQVAKAYARPPQKSPRLPGGLPVAVPVVHLCTRFRSANQNKGH
ncbi:MAG: hypothetical protein Q9M35_13010 [Rhodothermus sp.]|nr:hypothetical protein [Rhodothermus sp.]